MKTRPGIALLLALLVLVVAELMTASLLALGTQALVVADANTRSIRAQMVAENGVSQGLNDLDMSMADSIAVGHSRSLPANSSAPDETLVTYVERLTATSYLVQSEARVGSPRTYAVARASALRRTLDPVAVLSESNAAVAAGKGVVLAGAARLASTADDTCAAELGLEAHRDSAAPFAPTDSVALGGAAWSQIRRMAPQASVGEFPLIYADTSVTFSNGDVAAILVVAGAVHLTGDVTFVGLIVAAGDIEVTAGATVYGAVRARGLIRITDATVAYSRCVLASAVAASNLFRAPIPASRRFIPAF